MRDWVNRGWVWRAKKSVLLLEVELANRLAQEVEKVLSAAVGDFIAKATTRKNCELLGTTPDDLRMDQLDELAEKIGKSVSFFSGKEVGNSVAEKIKEIKGY
jgi:hypothetical protein